MLSDGLEYPLEGEGLKRIGIGGLVSIAGIFILPLFIVLGYLIKVGAESSKGVDKPVEFENWGELFKKGLVGALISLVYSAVPFILYFVMAFLMIGVIGLGSASDSGLIAGFGFVALMIFFALWIPIILLISYIVPAALISYGRHDSFGAAFDFAELKTVLLSTDYLVAALMPLLIAFAMNIAFFVLSITIVGLVLVPFVQFYASVAMFRMFGVAYGETSGKTNSGSHSTPTAAR